MNRTKRTEITIETVRVVVVRGANRVVSRCSRCGAERLMTMLNDETPADPQQTTRTPETGTLEMAEISQGGMEEDRE